MSHDTDPNSGTAAWQRVLGRIQAALPSGVLSILVIAAALALATAGGSASGAPSGAVSGASGGGDTIPARSSIVRAYVASPSPSVRDLVGDSDTVRAHTSVAGVIPPVEDAYVRVRIHTCPDDLVASAYLDYLSACTDTTRQDGVPIGLSLNGGPVSLRYTVYRAGAMATWDTPPGTVTISDPTPGRLREPAVFCQIPVGEGADRRIESAPVGPTVDGNLVRVLSSGENLFCDWYRFPGGVLSVDDPLRVPPADGVITVRTRTCTPRPGQPVFGPANGTDPFPIPFDGNARFDQGHLDTSCPESATPQDVTIGNAGTGFSATATIANGSSPVSWTGLAAGDYTIASTVPAGYGAPYVYCQVTRVAPDVLPGYVSMPVSGGAFILTMAANPRDNLWSCTWYNVVPTGAPAAADVGSSSITIAAWQCPADLDFDTAARGGECLDEVSGLTFVTEGAGATLQTDTGDSRPGAVHFGGIDPGLYTVRTPDTQATPVVYCDGVDVPFADGGILITLPAHNDLQCDWNIPSGDVEANGSASAASDAADAADAAVPADPADPAASADPGMSDPGEATDPLADTDADGLIDTDETGTWGTNPLNADTDGDGLLDGAELTWNGTDPLLDDTDTDGLTDGAEVNVTLTDPLDDDSDNDTYTDGYEVQIGSDPNNDQEIPVS